MQLKFFSFIHTLKKYISIVTGTIGHVAHGKSTVVKAISGVQVRREFTFIHVYSISVK